MKTLFLISVILIFGMFFVSCSNGVPVESEETLYQYETANPGELVINGAAILAYYRSGSLDKFPPYIENRHVSLIRKVEIPLGEPFDQGDIKCFDVGETRNGKLYIKFPEISDEYFAYLDDLEGFDKPDPAVVFSPPGLKYKLFELGGLWPDRSEGEYLFLYANMDGEVILDRTSSQDTDIAETIVFKKGWNVFLDGVNMMDSVDLSRLIWLEESEVRQIPFGGL
jgi:hypothetical protein